MIPESVDASMRRRGLEISLNARERAQSCLMIFPNNDGASVIARWQHSLLAPSCLVACATRERLMNTEHSGAFKRYAGYIYSRTHGF